MKHHNDKRGSVMKRITTLILTVAVSTLFLAVSIMAEDKSPTKFNEDLGTLLVPSVKNECLLVAKNCEQKSSSVQERVNDLKREIDKGLDVYTPEELKAMEEQLRWIDNDSANKIDMMY
jgi:hypothetical protein